MTDDTLSIVSYAITPETPAAQVAETLSRLDACMERAKELRKAFEADLCEWITVNGPLDTGRMFYWLGHPKETKCTDRPGAAEALLEASGGNFRAFSRNFLSSDAIKHGAAKQALPPDVYERLFTVIVKDKLESGEKLPKKLLSADREFVKP